MAAFARAPSSSFSAAPASSPEDPQILIYNFEVLQTECSLIGSPVAYEALNHEGSDAKSPAVG
ncbi:hypothetical protein ACP70R_000693 [Stipagrostis hirtigluma subsp. patula]